MEVIKKLNITIHEGEIVAVVGASGSGKSLLANAILGILPDHAITHGTLLYKGENIKEVLRGKEISIIPQSIHSLNPLMKTGKQVQGVIHQSDRKVVQQDIFERVGLPEDAENKYPFELSGGMARRVLAAAAMVSPAELIIADEPTPGLDPKVLKETISLLKQLAREGKGIMFISHDIDTALTIADKVVVFYKGETIESADAAAFSGKGERLRHPYSKALWNRLPRNEFFQREKEMEQKQQSGEMLEIRGISYKYGNGPYVFKDLDLSLQPGEIVGLHGYSGSGKTTMAKVMAGYFQPEAGTIRLGGKKIKKKGMHPVQLIWQHPEKAINPRWQMHKVLAETNMENSPLLNELGIQEEWLSRWPSELSGGELQRFCIARALHDGTKYLIADEMTTMLDAVTQAKLWEMVLRIAKARSIGVLAISHDHQLLQRISDRMINFNEINHVHES